MPDFLKKLKTARVKYLGDELSPSLTLFTIQLNFGNFREHSIVFEKTVQIRDHKPFPRCPAGVRGGKNACPPEDAGGIPGFENLCEIIADPKHEEYGEMMEWLESSGYENYDPTFFDPKAIEFRNSVFYGWGLDE